MGRTFGSGKYLDCGNAAPLTTAYTQFSFSLWFKVAAGGGAVELISRNYTVWEVQRNGTAFVLYANGGEVTFVASAAAEHNGEWHNLIGIYDKSGSNTLKGYIDGSLRGTVAPNSIPSSSNSLEIGRRRQDGEEWPGDLAEIAIWNRLLTTDEIAAMAAGAPASYIPTGLDGYWPLEGVASPEPDLSANGNDAAVTGASASATHPTIAAPPEDKQLQELDEATELHATDIVFAVQNPDGTPVGVKVPLGMVQDFVAGGGINGVLALKDGVTAPSAVTGFGVIFIDAADGDLKIKFPDGTVKLIVLDT